MAVDTARKWVAAAAVRSRGPEAPFLLPDPMTTPTQDTVAAAICAHLNTEAGPMFTGIQP